MFSSNIWKFDNVERKIRFYQKVIAVDENHHQIASISLGCSTQTLSWGRIVDNKLWPGSIYGHHQGGGASSIRKERKGEKNQPKSPGRVLFHQVERKKEQLKLKLQLCICQLPFKRCPLLSQLVPHSTGPPFKWSPIQLVPHSTGPPFNWSKNMFHTGP